MIYIKSKDQEWMEHPFLIPLLQPRWQRRQGPGWHFSCHCNYFLKGPYNVGYSFWNRYWISFKGKLNWLIHNHIHYIEYYILRIMMPSRLRQFFWCSNYFYLNSYTFLKMSNQEQNNQPYQNNVYESVAELGAKMRTKIYAYRFLASECCIYLPEIQTVTVWHCKLQSFNLISLF